MFSSFRPVRAILAFLFIAVLVAPLGGAQNAPLGIVVQPSDLTVTIATDKNAYQIGEKVQITGTVNQNAYLYIVDVDAANRVTLIFPNAFSANNQINAGPYSLPDKPTYNLTVTPPAGVEFLYAVASTEPLNLQAVFNAANPFASLGNPQNAQSRIQGAIQGLQPTAKSAVAFVSFVVGGQQQPPTTGTALLSVESSPSGAQVFLNGQSRGTTPATFLLSAGLYQILLRANGCQDFLANIVLAAGEQRRLAATLNCQQQPPVTPPTNPQDPAAQLAAQAQTILPSDPRFAVLSTQFYTSLGQNAQGLAARLQAAPGAAPLGVVPQPNPTQGAQFQIFPEVQNLNLNQVVLQQGQTVLLGTITLPTNANVGGLPLSAGVYGVAAMDGGALGLMTDSASNAFHGGFVIVLINFSTGSIVCFFYFPTVTFFPIFFPIFSPIYVFQIIIQITIVTPFPFPFPFPFPTLGCPALPFVNPINVAIGGPNDSLVTTTAFVISEVGLSLSGVLIRVQSLGPGLSFQLVTGSVLRFGSIFPTSSALIALPVGASFVLRVDGGGKTGCVNATTNFFTITGTASNN